MHMSYMLRNKSAILISLVLLGIISINFISNLNRNNEILYVTEMFSFVKVLTLSDWTMAGYFMMQYYPLLVVIPTACVYISDRNSGINTYIQSRVGKRNYWYGKLISVFVLTLIIFIVPYLIEIVLSVICFSLKSNGDPSGIEFWQSVETEGQYLLSNILLSNRIIYAVIMAMLFGIVSAVLATFNFSITTLPIFKFKILTYFPIYILLFAISLLPKIVKLKFTVDYCFILRMFENANAKNYPVYSVFLITLLVVSVFLIELKIKKEELV